MQEKLENSENVFAGSKSKYWILTIHKNKQRAEMTQNG